MNELKFKYQYIPPVTVHLPEEITTSKLSSSSVEGFEAQIASLVEMFLVEVYRCKLCQFTSSIKNKIKTHVFNIHEQDGCHPSSECQEISTDPDENDSYSIGDEISQENKENEENLEKMSFLLPMYRMLHNMSPECCDMNLDNHSVSTHAPNACDVNTLFEEESEQFHLEEPCSMVSNQLSAYSSDLTESKKSKEDEEAQSEHLMSLGLCRISSVKSLVMEQKVPKLGTKQEMGRSQKREKTDKNNLSQALKDIYSLKSSDERHLCTSCDRKFMSKDALEIHAKCHNGNQGFQCLYCNFSVTEWSLMEKHLKSHKKGKRSYRCLTCEKVFMTQSAWKVHKESHKRRQGILQHPESTTLYKTELVENLPLTCHHEDSDWPKVHKHLNSSHEYKAKPHPCTECEKKFFRITDLKKHMSKHKKARPFLCSLCDQTFKYRRQMSRHHKHAHQKLHIKERKKRKKAEVSLIYSGTEATARTRKNADEFTCKICNRKCSSKLALQRHMGIHAGVKPFHCQHCDYKTRLKASLIQHMRIHTGEKPFKCEICSYASIDASSLRRHFRTHTRERPYKCQLCSYSSIQKKSLDLHVRRHHTGETFGCSFCCYSSPDKQLLRKHIKKYHLNLETPMADT
ncbi:gastrula zinc finger protein XlCGF26.1-like isoform X1 [Monodelphis domestica]|uniref:gastrula zinc finger protein XlCGF26.1-like isoform X1 n=1 Tax=Monodelphis domestica TaxID=13616 RepID=UPI0024E220C3|nr:gastrula zinc finger protein XlCGF26.1-like isoform X1 [Monodelphis domestica]XP_056679350.1 gastrula zinc finger protein XlCGF26.1-like isoform X1 [Monodelphis domestica]XP_056679351.1 gastrula zinc finger protein XlCGF26.1-like isoform X1 [Monodelphis domestica]